MTRIILVRHGQSEANARAIFAGHSDFDLTEFGRRQAELVADYLTRNEKIDTIYSSDLSRAYHTATPTAERLGLPIKKSETLREIYAGLWDGMQTDDIAARFPEDFNCWREDFSHVRCTGGESIPEVFCRTVPYICDISRENDGKTVLIASHATVVRCFNAYAMGLTYDSTAGSPMAYNASISIYTMDGDRVVDSQYNIVEHLGDLVLRIPTKFNS